VGGRREDTLGRLDEPPDDGARLGDDSRGGAELRGAALSHHHGIGLNRGRYVRAALGAAHDVLAATKAALDPVGILNPGKLGLPSPWGEPAWP
jgi:alkyldihydroxyacetonephosphate synthase